MVDVYLGIGSNIDPEDNIKKAKEQLAKLCPSVIFSRSFESEAVGFSGDNFLNLVAKISKQDSSCSNKVQITQLGEVLKNIESDLGRTRADEKFASRVVDIDILLFGDLILSHPIQLPRDEILQNAYVLWPLSELAPDLIHPVEKKSYLWLWENFDKSKQVLCPI